LLLACAVCALSWCRTCCGCATRTSSLRYVREVHARIAGLAATRARPRDFGSPLLRVLPLLLGNAWMLWPHRASPVPRIEEVRP